MIDKTKILGYILYGKYCRVKSPTVVKKKKKLTVLCMHSKTAHRDPILRGLDHIVVKAMKYL